MNIRDAQKQIKNTVSIYLEKDEMERYEIPAEKQRPVFLMGAPGIGKTAIMEQIAQALNIALVSYTMTHHTRQSALGLPFIVKREFNGEQVSVSEYTMSEIIATVYKTMEQTGFKEGILFLDEINCVSETLAPAMLQFLQYKIFGQHRLPDGWIVVAAGNPPEYNNSVREFDIATWDRLKRVDVEPNYAVWKEYAVKAGVHPSILAYLDVKKENFYSIETTVDGKVFVTARGWEDLSRAIILYEKKGIEVDNTLISQYIQAPKIAKDFSVYYALFKRYQSDYQIESILFGNPPEKTRQRAVSADFNERISVLGLLVHSLTTQIKHVLMGQDALISFGSSVKEMKSISNDNDKITDYIGNELKSHENDQITKKKAGNLSKEQQKISDLVNKYLGRAAEIAAEAKRDGTNDAFVKIREYFAQLAENFQEEIQKTSSALSNVFYFCEDVFEKGNEMLILVTELTENYYAAKYIGQYGCREYFKYNKELLFYERQQNIVKELEELGL